MAGFTALHKLSRSEAHRMRWTGKPKLPISRRRMCSSCSKQPTDILCTRERICILHPRILAYSGSFPCTGKETGDPPPQRMVVCRAECPSVCLACIADVCLGVEDIPCTVQQDLGRGVSKAAQMGHWVPRRRSKTGSLVLNTVALMQRESHKRR